MMNMRFRAMVLAGAVAACGLSSGAAPGVNAVATDKAPAFNKMLPHSDSQFAHELLLLNQPDLIKAQEEATKGAASENLWKAQAIVGTWSETAKNRSETLRAAADYLAAMN